MNRDSYTNGALGHQVDQESSVGPSRREFMSALGSAAVLTALAGKGTSAQTTEGPLNIARVAIPMARTMQSENKISALNDGFIPENSFDRSHALYALRTWPESGERANWVQYEWAEPVNVNKVEVYWAVDRPRPAAIPGSAWQQIKAPESYRILHWNGNDFVPVVRPQGLGVAPDTFNITTFEPVLTSKLRLEVIPQSKQPAGILEWRVFNYGPAPELPPIVDAGVDRSVVSNGRTYLSGKATWLHDSSHNRARWMKTSGPGNVIFDAANLLATAAAFTAPGDYVLALQTSGKAGPSPSINVHVESVDSSLHCDVRAH
jgi:hypothetical protein